jgi:TolB-like protein
LRYLFENYAFDTERRELSRGTNVVAVAPRVFDLLDYLISNRQRVVSKDDLITAVWNGRIVSDAALTTRLNAARRAIGDTGEAQRLIKTLPRKGVRFVGTVQEAQKVAAEFNNVPARTDRIRSGGDTLNAALPLPDKPSIAVLPFDNMTEAAENLYFSDGIAEDIITELSRYPDLFVIARNSSFVYRGKAARVTDAASELGVQYVLEGSVRRDGTNVRLTAQLIDAVSGKNLWAQRYDRELKDVFAVQDDVTRNIVAVLPARIEAAAVAEATRKGSNSLEANDYLLRGKYNYHLHSREANQKAQLNFDHAIQADPRFATAYAWRACTLGQAVLQGFRPPTAELQLEFPQFCGDRGAARPERHRM